MTATSGTVVPLLVFEAADCLMAVPASEVAHLERGQTLFLRKRESRTAVRSWRSISAGANRTGRGCDGDAAARSAWLRVRRVIDVVPVALSGLTPMPALLRGERRTRAFLAAGVRGDDVFLLLDPRV